MATTRNYLLAYVNYLLAHADHSFQRRRWHCGQPRSGAPISGSARKLFAPFDHAVLLPSWDTRAGVPVALPARLAWQLLADRMLG